MGLFDSGSIRDLTVPNRGLYRPVRTRLGESGQPTAALKSHLVARASGGAGGIVGPADMLVHDSASGPAYLEAHRSDNVERFGEITDAVHDEGSIIVGQLTHPGAEETGDWEMQEQLGPSSSPSDAAYEMPKPMTTDEIRSVQDGFVASAENLVAAGFDGVELAANPFSVLRQFLSPRFNTREDEYGGDWASRARFLNETLDRVGSAVDVPVGVHLSLSELVYGGYQFEDAPDLVGAIEGFDYLSCTLGTRSTFNQTHAGFADGQEPIVDAIETVADSVDAPIVGRAQFTTVADAERLLDAGADFVSFTRQLVADPETLNAVANDESYHRCIECNQKCLEGIYAHAHGGHIECVVNPRTGRERELPPLSAVEPAAIEQDVLVVGGGPAGLRFAAIATERGHTVTLREAADELGGQLTTAATGMFEPFARATEDLIRDVEASSVTVETGTEVTAEDVESTWDTVVVATGATRPELPDTEGKVVDAFDVLDGTDVGENVLLYDDNRWMLTHQTANRLLAQGVDLEIATRDHYPGFRTEQANLPGLVAALQAQGATFTGNHALDDVAEDGTVTLRNTLTGETETRTPDDVVYVGRRQAAESLYTELKGEVDDLYRIGDAVSPRKLDRAYHDGEMLARRL